jgi:molybdenum cofactor cytidylyltransferase
MSRASLHVVALVLAAGHSTRMEGANKLLLPLHDGTGMLERTVQAVLSSAASQVIVVTGHDDRAVRDALAAYEVTVAYNPKHRFGMSTSLRRGLIAAGTTFDGVLICLGDMPFVRSETIDALLRQFTHAPPGCIIQPTYDGRPGHPVLFASTYRDELMALEGDVGARALLDAHAEDVQYVPAQDPGILRDVDTREAYDRALQSGRKI